MLWSKAPFSSFGVDISFNRIAQDLTKLDVRDPRNIQLGFWDGMYMHVTIAAQRLDSRLQFGPSVFCHLFFF